MTSKEHLAVLRRRGFNRVSMGVQDFDPEVQELVNRVQPYDMTKALVDAARELGYSSVNLDMIYGLPGQTRAGFEKSVEQILSLRPDRVAMYSYAHVPWLKRPQRVLAAHLPEGTEKFAIFVSGIERFVAAGYVYIGMDHFALPHDEIVKAQNDRTLHRNFQGYTTHAGCDLYGLGVSAIGSVDDMYVQNTKDYAAYHRATDGARFATVKGHRLSPDDFLRRDVITRLLCHCVIDKREIERECGLSSFDETFASAVAQLPDFVEDGMVELTPDEIRVTTLGRIFIRNVAMLFDEYLEKKAPTRRRSSPGRCELSGPPRRPPRPARRAREPRGAASPFLYELFVDPEILGIPFAPLRKLVAWVDRDDPRAEVRRDVRAHRLVADPPLVRDAGAAPRGELLAARGRRRSRARRPRRHDVLAAVRGGRSRGASQAAGVDAPRRPAALSRSTP